MYSSEAEASLSTGVVTTGSGMLTGAVVVTAYVVVAGIDSVVSP